LAGVDELVISLAAKGLTTGEISAHLADGYGAAVSRDTISRITDRVVEELADWQSRPLDSVYPVVFIDAIHVKIRDGKVVNRPVYSVVGVSVNGERDILGLWVGDGGEGAKYWHQVLSELQNRGVQDVCIVVCDGLKRLPEAIADVWPQAIVQTCVLHLIRNSFRYASKADWGQIAKDLRPIYTAPTEQAAAERLDELEEKWGQRYPRSSGSGGTPGPVRAVPGLQRRDPRRHLQHAIEALNRQLRKAVKTKGSFPIEQAALKCLYLTVRSLDPTGRGRVRWMNRCKAALNAFAITFEGRIP
jgi:putative transposase